MRISQGADGARAPFDCFTIALHWLTVLVVSLLAASGLVVQFAAVAVLTLPVLDLHRSLGAALWSVTLLRLFWRASLARFPEFPRNTPRGQQRLAILSEHLLYALLLAQPVTGFLMTLFLGRPFRLLAWTIPPLIH